MRFMTRMAAAAVAWGSAVAAHAVVTHDDVPASSGRYEKDKVAAFAQQMDAAEVDKVSIDFSWATLGAGAGETYTLTKGPTGYVLNGDADASESMYDDNGDGTNSDRAKITGRRTLKQVNALRDLWRARPMSRDSALGVIANNDWAKENEASAFASLYLNRCAESEEVFSRQFMDTGKRIAATAGYFEGGWTDDYPTYRVSIVLSSGKTLSMQSRMQATPTIQWSQDGVETWNPDIPNRIAALLPAWSTMGRRMTSRLEGRNIARGFREEDAIQQASAHCLLKHR